MSIAGLDHIGHKPGTAERIFGQVPAWLWFGAGLFLLMVIGGNRSLQDADTYWQIVVGQSIIDHRALPHTDCIRSRDSAHRGCRRPGWRRFSMPHRMQLPAGPGR